MFTRQGDTVYTRIDRFYASRHHSHWVWNQVGIDAAFCRRSWNPDHIAVTATIEPLHASKSKAHQSRIDPEVLRSGKVRTSIRALWERTYAHFDVSLTGHAAPWEDFKSQAYLLLLGATEDLRRQRKEAKGAVAKLEKELQTLAEEASTQNPF